MNAVSLNNLWTYLQGLSLTASNRKWLAEKLKAPAEDSRLNPCAKRMTAYERSLRDVEEGRVYEAKDVDDLFKQIFEE